MCPFQALALCDTDRVFLYKNCEATFEAIQEGMKLSLIHI